MHAVSTILFLASMGTGAFAIDLVGSPFHGIVFTSVDSNCFLPGAPFTPSDGDKGQFADEIKGVKSQLDCKRKSATQLRFRASMPYWTRLTPFPLFA